VKVVVTTARAAGDSSAAPAGWLGSGQGAEVGR
jgi:hypothetical protein